MKYLIALFFLCIQFPVKAEDTTPAAETILVKEGDIVQHPLDAEPVEVEALMNGLFYNCTIMPGDSFEITFIRNRSGGNNKIIIIKKTEGIPGDQKICHRNSSILYVMGISEIIKTKEGLPKKVTKLFYPFVFVLDNLENAQKRKKHEMEDFPSTAETVLFKKGDTFVYPSDAKPIEVKAIMNGLFYSCTIASGDPFEVVDITNYPSGGAQIHFWKTGGMPGDQKICHLDSGILIEAEECKLIRTEKGIPEAVNCRLSLKNLFNLLAWGLDGK